MLDKKKTIYYWCPFIGSVATIDAVLNSRSHGYIFFVADPYNPGYHLFASTLRQHNKNKRVYTKWLNSKKIYR